MSYADDAMAMDELEGAECPRCGDWHSPDGMGPEPEDYCKREI